MDSNIEPICKMGRMCRCVSLGGYGVTRGVGGLLQFHSSGNWKNFLDITDGTMG
jgi:hypothetical protein